MNTISIVSLVVSTMLGLLEIQGKCKTMGSMQKKKIDILVIFSLAVGSNIFFCQLAKNVGNTSSIYHIARALQIPGSSWHLHIFRALFLSTGDPLCGSIAGGAVLVLPLALCGCMAWKVLYENNAGRKQLAVCAVCKIGVLLAYVLAAAVFASSVGCTKEELAMYRAAFPPAEGFWLEFAYVCVAVVSISGLWMQNTQENRTQEK